MGAGEAGKADCFYGNKWVSLLIHNVSEASTAADKKTGGAERSPKIDI